MTSFPARLCLLVILQLALGACGADRKPEDPKAAARDFSQHPKYSTYAFDRSHRVIDFGTQPLAVPTGTIAELLKRDRTLGQYLEHSGQELRVHPFSEGTAINFFMARGDLDVAVAGDMPTLRAASRGEVLVCALVKQNFSSIIVREPTLPQGLRGKRIGYVRGSSAHYTLLQMLSAVGMNMADVHLVAVNVSKMPDALAAHEIDAFAAWEPTPTRALAQHPEFSVLYRGLSTSYLYFRKSWAEENPEAVRAILAAQVRGMRWMRASEENLSAAGDWTLAAAQEFSGTAAGLSRQDMGRLIEEGLLSISYPPFVPVANLEEGGALQREFSFLKDLGLINASAEWDATAPRFDRTVMTDIASNPREYQLNVFDYEP